MSQQTDAADADDGAGDEDAAGRAPAGRMVYHLFATEQRRRIVSIFLDNHAVAFSAAAMASATKMDEDTAARSLEALTAAGFLAATDPNEAYRLAASDDADLQRIVGDLDEDPVFYRLNKDDELAVALAKADSVAARRAAEFYRAAPDLDRD